MFDHTALAFQIIIKDFKKWSLIFKIIFSVFYCAYLVYSIIMKLGMMVINVILLTFFILYTAFELIASKKEIKLAKKIVAKSYKWIKITIKAFTLGSTLYGVYIAATSINAFTIILTVLTIIMWVLQVLIEVVIIVLEPRVKLIIGGVLQDATPIVNVINKLPKVDIVLPTNSFQKEMNMLKEVVDEKKPPKKEKFSLFKRKEKIKQ